MNATTKKLLPHILAPVIFLCVVFIYFSPLLQGKALFQQDTTHYRGMAKEIIDYREKTGEEPLWTNSMFGGMPAYLISTRYPSNLFRFVDRVISLNLPVPARYIFLIMIGFYLFLVAGYRVNPWLGIVGALAFGFSSYFFIIEAAGHNSKAHAIAFMAPVLLGIIIAYRGKFFLGSVLTGVFLALQIHAGHLQITYYTFMMVLVLGIILLIQYIREKQLSGFFKPLAFLIIGVIFAVGSNIASIWLTYEYGKVSIRGKSELTSDQENITGGLDKDYILNDYSYGIAETFNLLIPNFVGGASSGFDTSSKTYDLLRKNNVPNARQMAEQLPLAYWGPQRFTSGPVYIGAVVIFLFVFGLFLVKGREKWWVVTVVLLAVFLAWGKHFQIFSEIFINYFPGYSKFRTVSMTLVMAELAIPLLGILAVKEMTDGQTEKKDLVRALRNTLYIVGGITLFFTLFPGVLFSFHAPIDEQLSGAGWPVQFLDAIREDRKMLLQKDAFRSLVFVLLSAGTIWAYIEGKLKVGWLYPVLGMIILFDLWPVNKRYLNNKDFGPKQEITHPFKPTEADLEILQDKDPDYRVLNLTVNTFNDASTSYFHKSIGGYHGAKIRRYQDLITHQISANNLQVLNMLNTRYIIVNDNGKPVAQRNPNALGNGWFVAQYKIVPDADHEMEALTNFIPAEEAIIDQRFSRFVEGLKPYKDSLSEIKLLSYAPNHLVYESHNTKEGLAVFSEIYYDKGWSATVDGKPVDYFRVNYILRGMVLPAGDHRIEFSFRPKGYFVGEKISLASSSLLLILLCVGIWKETRQKRQ